MARGQVIGYVGVTGNASPDAPHLHFAIFRLLTPRRSGGRGTTSIRIRSCGRGGGARPLHLNQCEPNFFSPASTLSASLFSAGGSGQVAKAVKAQGGL